MQTWIQSFAHEFSHIFIMVLPYFFLGITAGALLESKGNFDFIDRWLGKGKKTIFFASILGAILPGCACATMPMTEGLIRKGARIGTVTAFTMTSPLLSPQSVILTFALLGSSFTIARVTFGLLGGIGIGFLIYYFESKKWVSLPTKSAASQSCCSSKTENPSFKKSFISITKKLGGYLIIGLAIASALTVSFPTDLIPSTIGQHPGLGYLIATLVGIPIYICEGEEVPITYSLITLGLASGPAFTFLLGAVGTCIPTLIFAKKIFGKKTMIIYAIYWAIFAPLAGIIFSYFA